MSTSAFLTPSAFLERRLRISVAALAGDAGEAGVVGAAGGDHAGGLRGAGGVGDVVFATGVLQGINAELSSGDHRKLKSILIGDVNGLLIGEIT
jgi:hypothetical protein